MARGGMGGKISRGTCEGCKRDIGNTLDPYCWDCARQLERAIEARRKERIADLVRQQADPDQAARIRRRETISAALDRFNRKEA